MSPSFVSAVIVGLVLLAACGKSEPARTPAGGKVSCTSDSDCVVTSFAGCCSCCPDAPHAVPATALESQKAKCAAVDCAACSERVDCPKVEAAAGKKAICRDGTCAVAPS